MRIYRDFLVPFEIENYGLSGGLIGYRHWGIKETKECSDIDVPESDVSFSLICSRLSK